MSKKITVIILSVGAIGLVGYVLGLRLVDDWFNAQSQKQTAAKNAEAFLKRVVEDREGSGNMAERFFSKAVSKKWDEAKFRYVDFLYNAKRTELSHFTSVSWESRSVSSNEAVLEGMVTTKNGSQKPILIGMVYEQMFGRERNDWHINSVNFGGVDLFEFKLPPPDPIHFEREASTQAERFYDAMRFGHIERFERLHLELATSWKQKTTPEKLREAYPPIAKNWGGRFNTVVKHAVPLAPNDDGYLEATVQIPTSLKKVQFELKYEAEGRAWKLAALSVRPLD